MLMPVWIKVSTDTGIVLCMLIHSVLVVSMALRENTYPFLAVIVLKDNRMTVVARIEGAISK